MGLQNLIHLFRALSELKKVRELDINNIEIHFVETKSASEVFDRQMRRY